MRKLVMAVLAATFMAISAQAQEVELGASVDLTHVRFPGQSFNFKGFDGSVQFNFNPTSHAVISLEAEAADVFGDGPKVIDIMAGPKLSYRASARFQPFAHILAGLEKVNRREVPGDDKLAVAIGGGIDIPVVGAIVFRPVQFDVFRTEFRDGHSNRQYSLRYLAGFVVRF